MKREKLKLYYSTLLALIFYPLKDFKAVFSQIDNYFFLYHILTDKDYKT